MVLMLCWVAYNVIVIWLGVWYFDVFCSGFVFGLEVLWNVYVAFCQCSRSVLDKKRVWSSCNSILTNYVRRGSLLELVLFFLLWIGFR